MSDELIVSQRARDAAARLEDELGFLTELEMPIVRQFLAQFEADTLASQARQIEALRRALVEQNAPSDDLAACERAIDRMGWPEIHAFMNAPGQAASEDAGGFILRKIKALFGIKTDPVETYQEAARRLVNAARATLEETSRG